MPETDVKAIRLALHARFSKVTTKWETLQENVRTTGVFTDLLRAALDGLSCKAELLVRDPAQILLKGVHLGIVSVTRRDGNLLIADAYLWGLDVVVYIYCRP